jgi:hypothetical protein
MTVVSAAVLPLSLTYMYKVTVVLSVFHQDSRKEGCSTGCLYSTYIPHDLTLSQRVVARAVFTAHTYRMILLYHSAVAVLHAKL